MYVELLQEVRRKLNIKDTHIMKLESAVYGLRNAPRQWYLRLKKELIALGCRVHQLDTCLFMLYENESLVGIVGAYVDDCLMCGNTQSPKWNSFIKNFK